MHHEQTPCVKIGLPRLEYSRHSFMTWVVGVITGAGRIFGQNLKPFCCINYSVTSYDSDVSSHVYFGILTVI